MELSAEVTVVLTVEIAVCKFRKKLNTKFFKKSLQSLKFQYLIYLVYYELKIKLWNQ